MNLTGFYNMDCMEGMKHIPDKSVDLVFTSPPYNMNLRIRNGKYCSRQIVKEISTKYKNFDDNLPMEEYYEFNKKVISELLRVSDLVFYNVQFLTGNKRALFKLIGDFNEKLKEIIVWDKINAQPAIGQNVMNSQFEVILVFDDTDSISRRFRQANFERGTLSNVWRIKRGKKYSTNHGATFPVELAEKVVTNFCVEGGIVLDPFMGLGTTAIACLNTGRQYIGFEIDEDYFRMATERLEKHKAQLNMFLDFEEVDI